MSFNEPCDNIADYSVRSTTGRTSKISKMDKLNCEIFSMYEELITEDVISKFKV